MTDLLGLVVLILFAGVVLVVGLTVMLVRQARWPPRRTAAYAIARGMPCDPGEIGLAFEEWWLDVPGARLPVWEIAGHGGERGGALTAVLVHGWGQSRLDALERLDPWPALTGRIVLYDLRGHGESEGGPSRLGVGEERDLVALLERLGEGPFVLVGLSMGGVIAVEAAAAGGPAPPPVAGVVVQGSYHGFHDSLRGRMRTQELPAWPLTDLAMAWFRLRGLRHRSLLAAAAALPCPLLVVHGAGDTVVPPEQARALERAAPDATLHVVRSAAHLDAHVVDAPGLDAVVRRFVDRLDIP